MATHQQVLPRDDRVVDMATEDTVVIMTNASTSFQLATATQGKLAEATKPRKPTVGAFFCGMGGFASGMLRAGFDVRWANDNNKWACEAFRHRLPEIHLVEKDVWDIDVETDNLCDVDVVIGGFPCQPFSVAGHRRGFADERGQALDGMFEVIDSLASQPLIVVLENVPAIYEWAEEVIPIVEGYGYKLPQENFWDMNVQRDSGIPQDRRRIFMIATLSETHLPKPELISVEQYPLKNFIDKTRKASPELYLDKTSQYYPLLQEKIEGGSTKNLYHLRRVYVREKLDELCPTLTANMGTGGHNVPFCKDRWGIRKLSPEETARLQGFDDCDVFPDELSNAQKYRLVGNAVCVSLAQLVGETIMDHLER